MKNNLREQNVLWCEKCEGSGKCQCQSPNGHGSMSGTAPGGSPLLDTLSQLAQSWESQAAWLESLNAEANLVLGESNLAVAEARNILGRLLRQNAFDLRKAIDE